MYHICLQDTFRLSQLLGFLSFFQAMLLPMPLRPLLLTIQSGFNVTVGQNERNVCVTKNLYACRKP